MVFGGLFLLVGYFVGHLISEKLAIPLSRLGKTAFSAIVGISVLTTVSFLVTLTIPSHSLIAAGWLSLFLGFSVIAIFGQKISWRLILKAREIAILLSVVGLSVFLNWRSLGYDFSTHEFLVTSAIWGDFSLHLAFIRSFSLGDNFPPQHPFFPGEFSRYQFMFDYAVGLLEAHGLPLVPAYNILSAIAFAGLILLLFELSAVIFPGMMIGILTIFLALFNSTLSFIYLFKEKDFFSGLAGIPQLSSLLTLGPWDGTPIVSALWNLDVFLNQRHTAFAMAIGIGIFAVFLRYLSVGLRIPVPWLFFAGASEGLLLFWSGYLFMISLFLTVVFLLLFKKVKELFWFTIFFLLFFLPQSIFLSAGPESKSVLEMMSFFPGYLAQEKTGEGIAYFWLLNLGVKFFLLPIAFLVCSFQQKKILLGVMSLFLLGNLLIFHPDPTMNHKIFLVWLFITNVFIAFLLNNFWRKWWGKILVPPVFFLLVFSGILDFIVIINDPIIKMTDFPADPLARWVKKTTSPTSVFLANPDPYTPYTLVGRKLFYGWPTYPAQAGYRTDRREKEFKDLYNLAGGSSLSSLSYFCRRAERKDIDYLVISQEIRRQYPEINVVEENKTAVFRYNDIEIYDLKSLCQNRMGD